MASRYPEPTDEQLQAALDALHAARPSTWPTDLASLGDVGRKLVRARAVQAMAHADLRSREQVPIACSQPDGSTRTRWVYGAPSNQLALGEEFK